MAAKGPMKILQLKYVKNGIALREMRNTQMPMACV